MRIAIIGAGLLGVSTAYFLCGRGHEIVVLERRQGPGLETSYANGGMITPSQADPWNAPGILRNLLKWIGRNDAPVLVRPAAVFSLLRWGIEFLRNSSAARFRINLAKNARLAAYSLRTLRELRAQSGIRYDESSRGTMRLYRDRRAFQSALSLGAELQGSGIRGEPLGPGEVVIREPALRPIEQSLAGGIYYPEDESGDAYQYCEAVAGLAAAHGVEFRYGTTVHGMERSGNVITAARTSAGAVQADRFILAAGSYSPVIGKSMGLSIPIKPVKGYSLTLEMNGWKGAPSVPVVDDERHLAATPLGRRLRVAGTAEFSGYNTLIDDRRIRHMIAFITDLYPGFKPYLSEAAATAWAGLRPYACDGVPILGRSPLVNLFLNTGHGHLGWSMAAGSGKLIADLITGQEPELDLNPYQLDRF